MVESVRALPNIGGGLMHGHSGHDQWTRLGLAKLRPNPLKASAKFTFSLGVRHGTILSGVTPKRLHQCYLICTQPSDQRCAKVSAKMVALFNLNFSRIYY